MEEQSDTPRVDAVLRSFRFIAHTDRAAAMWLDTVINIARDLDRELATATRERDEARAEVERLRAELFFVLRGDGLEHLYDGDCPVSNALHARDPQCPACKRLDELAATEAARKFCGVGELERAGYIPAGSADEREVKP